jgi:thiamine pyrophosphokinase
MNAQIELPSEFTLLLLGGEINDIELLLELAKASSGVVCADGAAELARKHSIKLSGIVGDLDSISRETLLYYAALGTTIEHKPDQQLGDFEKSMKCIREKQGRTHLRILGLDGKRSDHSLSNFSILARHCNNFESCVAYDDSSMISVLTQANNRMDVSDRPYARISLIPLPTATGVLTTGLKYPINNEDFIFGEREGLSNVIMGEGTCSITIRGGALLVSLERPHGPSVEVESGNERLNDG